MPADLDASRRRALSNGPCAAAYLAWSRREGSVSGGPCRSLLPAPLQVKGRAPQVRAVGARRRRFALRFPPTAYRSPPAMGYRAAVFAGMHLVAGGAMSLINAGMVMGSSAIGGSRRPCRDDRLRHRASLLAPMQRRLRSAATPLPRQFYCTDGQISSRSIVSHGFAYRLIWYGLFRSARSQY